MTQDTQDFIENLIANNHDLVVRTHIERIWTDTDEYQVIIGLGGQCPWDRNKTLFCRDNVHVEIDVEKGKVKAVEIMAGPEWFGNKPDWLQELWETRYDGNHLQLLFLNLVCRALP